MKQQPAWKRIGRYSFIVVPCLSFCLWAAMALPAGAVVNYKTYYELVKAIDNLETTYPTCVAVYDLKVGGSVVRTESKENLSACTITTVDATSPKKKFTSDDVKNPKTVYAGQTVFITDGANAGEYRLVKSWNGASGEIELDADMPNNLQVGQKFDIAHVIKAIEISDEHNAANNAARRDVVVTGGTHANEWIGIELALKLADYLASKASDTTKVEGHANFTCKNIVEQGEVVIIPCLNPSGFSWDRSQTPVGTWRKNRHHFDAADGVELNRNFDNGFWDPPINASDTPSANDYRGPAAGSENETKALCQVYADREVKGDLFFHCVKGCVSYPVDIETTANYWAAGKPGHGNKFLTGQIRDEVVLKNRSEKMITHIEADGGDASWYATEGGDWYCMSGGQVDYAYLKKHSCAVYVEFTTNKGDFTAATSAAEFAQIRDACLYFLCQCLDLRDMRKGVPKE